MSLSVFQTRLEIAILLQCVVCDLGVMRETHGPDVTELVRVHRLLESDEGQVIVQVA